MRAAVLTLVLGSVSASLVGCDKGPPKKSQTAENAAVTAPAPAPAPGAAPTTPATTAAAAGAAASPTGQSFGAGVKLATSTPIDAVLADPKKFAGQTIRVEGMVTDVCPKRGCWMELAGDKPGQKLKFKVTDGEMVFPMDAKGKKALAEGTVSVKELTLEQTKAYAEYQAKEYNRPYDPASITQPSSLVQLDGTGAVFLN